MGRQDRGSSRHGKTDRGIIMVGREDPIEFVPFKSLDLADPFFDSLRNSYTQFDDWFQRKARDEEYTYIVASKKGISAMLYLKEERDTDTGTQPHLRKPRLKIGTFKVDFSHHTSVGKRLLAVALRKFAESRLDYVYVTMFDGNNTRALRGLLENYGFKLRGSKGGEILLIKRRPKPEQTLNPSHDFPFIKPNQGKNYILAIKPEYHDRLFGDTLLEQQTGTPITDDKVVNTIEKIYLSGSQNCNLLNSGDHIISYRTRDPHSAAPAYYSSVISSVGTIIDVKAISSFANVKEFLDYIRGRSVFSDAELRHFYSGRRYPWIITFLYNFRFSAYPPRKALLDNSIISDNDRIVCEPITKTAFRQILKLGDVDEGFILN